MNESKIRFLLFLSILLIGFFIFISALVYESYYPVDTETFNSLNNALRSKFVRDSTVTGLAISIPILVEFIHDYITSNKHTKTEDFIARSIVLMFLFIPNAIVYLFIFTAGGPVAFGFIQLFSSVLYVWASFYYLYEKGTLIWGNNATIIMSLSYMIGGSLAYWDLLYPHLNMSPVKSAFYTISTILILRNTTLWIIYIQWATRS
mgnify:CR=1 FL=1